MSPDTYVLLQVISPIIAPAVIILMVLRKINIDAYHTINSRTKVFTTKQRIAVFINALELLLSFGTRWHRLPWRLERTSDWDLEEQAKKREQKV